MVHRSVTLCRELSPLHAAPLPNELHMLFGACRFAALVLCSSSAFTSLAAQQSTPPEPAKPSVENEAKKDSFHVQPALQRRDLWGVALVGLTTAVAIPFDKSLNGEFLDPMPQGSAFLKKNASLFNTLGSPGVLVASAAMWGLGEATHNSDLVKLGGHAGVAIAASGIVSTGLKYLIGRQRPFVEKGDPYDFAPLRGTHSGRSSLPSGHTTAAFAFAASMATDLRIDHPQGARWGVPLLYLGAASVGAARMYSNKHWMSDVVMGAGIGTLIGHRTVTYSRSHPTGWLSRHINGFSVAPALGAGGLAASITLR